MFLFRIHKALMFEWFFPLLPTANAPPTCPLIIPYCSPKKCQKFHIFKVFPVSSRYAPACDPTHNQKCKTLFYFCSLLRISNLSKSQGYCPLMNRECLLSRLWIDLESQIFSHPKKIHRDRFSSLFLSLAIVGMLNFS